MEKFDFSGWATRNDLLCGDGRTIRKNAFKDNHGTTVPLIWNHQHNDPDAVLGHALLENRDDGVYAYCTFNDTESGQTAKRLVHNGDVRSLSIWANKLKQIGQDVIHGTIRELSLVLAGANPGAFIDTVMAHSDDEGESLIISYDENIMLYHSDDEEDEEEVEETEDDSSNEEKEESEDSSEEVEESDISHADTKEDAKVAEEKKKPEGEETIEDVLDTLNEKQKNAVYAVIGMALEEKGADNDKEDDNMKHNVFDQEEVKNETVLSHSDQEAIMELAKKTSVGSFKEALRIYSEEKGLSHGLDLGDTETLTELLPDPKLLNPGAPEILGPDQSWVMAVINKTHKSPYSRIRTRYADARAAEIREKLKAKGYKKGEEKQLIEHIKLLKRSFDPQTIYVKDELDRDDIVDITDFDIVNYHWNMMKAVMYETLATAILVGDGRDDVDPDKIKEDHVRSIYNDDELYTMHVDVDVEAMAAELQGTDTDTYFGENFVFAEAIIQKALYAREQFKGSGRPDFYCTPHTVNKMLLARDRNGHRMYSSKVELAQALNVGAIHEIEQLEGKTREVEGVTKNLLGLFVNLADYQIGSTKGGEVTKFDDFDIDFNKFKYLMETRISGALVKPYAAIALEIPVEGAAG